MNIAFIVFNRPESTARVFAEIRKARPSRLFLIADGPRNADEANKCSRVREIAQSVDWQCEVRTNFSDVNMGCRLRIQSGIDWLFEQVESAIILEDDCLPDQSFFPFCDELLDRYAKDARICAISGCTCIKARSPYSYRFSHIPFIWGWATWRRAWQAASKDFPDLSEWNPPDPQFRAYWKREFESVQSGRLDSWDYQFVYSSFRNGWLTATSNTNLITNLGIGSEATNTERNDYVIPLLVRSVTFPLSHPPVEQDTKADARYFDRCLRPQMFPNLWERVKGKARLVLS